MPSLGDLGVFAPALADWPAGMPTSPMPIPALLLADTALGAGRTHLHRAAVIAASLAECATISAPRARPGRGVAPTGVAATGSPRVAFLFTGQGTICGMGRAPRNAAHIRQAMDRCGEILQSQLDRPLLSLLDPQAGSILDQTGYTQPVMLASNTPSLAELGNRSRRGDGPRREFAAVCVASIFVSLEDL